LSLASMDDPPAPNETALFALELNGQVRTCRLVDRGV
jgi:hypothetical protein